MRAICSGLALTLSAVVAFTGCSRGDAPMQDTTQPAASSAASPTVAEGPTDHPCKLLTDTEVRRVFPGAQGGTIRKESGVPTCSWKSSGGTFVIVLSSKELQPIEKEMKGWSLAFLDPLMPGAARAVRYETLSDVGDRAMAVVERADVPRGILTDLAALITQRQNRQALLFSTELATRERAAALRALADLGRAVAKRL